MKKLLMLFILIFFIAPLTANAEIIVWFKGKTVCLGYYDRHGSILDSLEGRRNKFGRDEFYHAGIVYPDGMDDMIIVESYENGRDIIIKGRVAGLTHASEIGAIQAQKRSLTCAYKVDRRDMGRNTKHIPHRTKLITTPTLKKITEQEALTTLRNWGILKYQ